MHKFTVVMLPVIMIMIMFLKNLPSNQLNNDS